MYQLFTNLLNMSITASILALLVILIRSVFKKLPKRYLCILWMLVAVRLICPIHISSSLSAFNLMNTDLNESGNVEFFSYVGEGVKSELAYKIPTFTGNPVSEENSNPPIKYREIYMPLIVNLWLAGIVLALGYAIANWISLKKKVSASMLQEANIYLCDDIPTSFILGVVRPRIYLSSGLDETTRANVIAHERAHLKRYDQWWKLIGFLLLIVYWINPILWISYVLFCRDLESACDESVIHQMDKEGVARYSEALLTCAMQKRSIVFYPLAFGETDIKGRVKNVLNYRKPSMWLTSLLTVVCIVIAVCFLTNPKTLKGSTQEGRSDTVENVEAAAGSGIASELEANVDGSTTYHEVTGEDVNVHGGELIGENTLVPATNEETTSQQAKEDSPIWELSMEELIRLVEDPSYIELQKKEGISFWNKYSNLEDDSDFNASSINNIKTAKLEYSGRQYELQVYYYPENSVEESVYPGAVDMILLWNQNEDSILLYTEDSKYTVNTDIEEFVNRQYLLPDSMMEMDYASSKLKGQVTTSNYTNELFLNFGGCFLEHPDFVPTTHGNYIPKSWYSLGGVGACIDPSYQEREKFQNGKLVEYNYTDNHMECLKISDFQEGEYTGCLYLYNVDLATASDQDMFAEGEATTEDFWVLFLTEGEGKPLYMKFFSSRYYSQEEVMQYIAL